VCLYAKYGKGQHNVCFRTGIAVTAADAEGPTHDSSRLSSSRLNNASARDGSSAGGSSPQTPRLGSRHSSPQNNARASDAGAAGAPPKPGGNGTAVPRRGGLELYRMPTLAPGMAPAPQREQPLSSRPQVGGGHILGLSPLHRCNATCPSHRRGQLKVLCEAEGASSYSNQQPVAHKLRHAKRLEANLPFRRELVCACSSCGTAASRRRRATWPRSCPVAPRRPGQRACRPRRPAAARRAVHPAAAPRSCPRLAARGPWRPRLRRPRWRLSALRRASRTTCHRHRRRTSWQAATRRLRRSAGPTGARNPRRRRPSVP